MVGPTVGGVARPLRLLPALALGIGALAACAAPAPTRGTPPSSNYSTSLTDLQDKVDAIAQDSCTTRPAVQAYPDCARYVAEVGNAALATQGAAASVTGAGQLSSTAARLADEVGQFSKAGCVAAPGVAGPPAQTCGDVLKKIQADLTTLRAELSAATTAGARPTP